MAEEQEPKKRTFAKTFMNFFGKKESQDLASFGREMSELSEEEKIQIADGIESGTLTY